MMCKKDMPVLYSLRANMSQVAHYVLKIESRVERAKNLERSIELSQHIIDLLKTKSKGHECENSYVAELSVRQKNLLQMKNDLKEMKNSFNVNSVPNALLAKQLVDAMTEFYGKTLPATMWQNIDLLIYYLEQGVASDISDAIAQFGKISRNKRQIEFDAAEASVFVGNEINLGCVSNNDEIMTLLQSFARLAANYPTNIPEKYTVQGTKDPIVTVMRSKLKSNQPTERALRKQLTKFADVSAIELQRLCDLTEVYSCQLL